jgi:outer membrane protein assembly factor BamB
VLVCYDAKTGEILWEKEFDEGFYSSPMIADDKLFIVDDDGTLTIARPSTSEYIELDSYNVLEGHDAWGPIALADGYMVIRDSKTMVCLDMAEGR